MLDTLQQPSNGSAIEHGGQCSVDLHAKPPLRFWEVQDFFTCPVVGMCLTQKEQQRLLKKSGFSLKKINDFEMHEALVASSANENRLSRRVDILLSRKFGKEAAALIALEDRQFVAAVKRAVETGDHSGALWAAATHPSLPMAMKREVFGEIHMSMHWSGEQRMKLQHKLTSLQEDLEETRIRVKQIAQEKRALEADNDALRKSQAYLKRALETARVDNRRMEEAQAEDRQGRHTERLEQENVLLRQELAWFKAEHGERQNRIAALLEENRQLSEELSRQGEMNRRITDETRTILAEMVPLDRCDSTCPSYDLCQKRILVVGGISRMASLYRELIENSGGVFEYHDGYMKKGSRALEIHLKRADVVLCPVSCNSHAACSIVKNLAKKHNKTVHMLPNSSLKSVSQAIWGEGDCRHTVN